MLKLLGGMCHRVTGSPGHQVTRSPGWDPSHMYMHMGFHGLNISDFLATTEDEVCFHQKLPLLQQLYLQYLQYLVGLLVHMIAHQTLSHVHMCHRPLSSAVLLTDSFCRLIILVIQTLGLMFRETEIFPSRSKVMRQQSGKVIRDLVEVLTCFPELPIKYVPPTTKASKLLMQTEADKWKCLADAEVLDACSWQLLHSQ